MIEASEYAARIDRLFLALTGVSALVCLLVGGTILVFSIRYRSGSGAPRERIPKLLSREIEIGWTAATAFAFLFFFFWVSSSGLIAGRAPDDALEVHVVAKQWMWKTRQPNGVREIDSLHVPQGQTVVVYLNSQDVIHSFYVPDLRIKQDVVPGRTATLTFTADRPGAYDLLCAEYCGVDHSAMRGEIVVMEPAAYARWLDARPAGETLVSQGRALFSSEGCDACHREGAAVQAPALEGLFGKRVRLEDGRSVAADEDYLRMSILKPRQDVVAGFQPIMPDFSTRLDDPQVTALVAYLRSLGDEE